jgi:hypothetical protein
MNDSTTTMDPPASRKRDHYSTDNDSHFSQLSDESSAIDSSRAVAPQRRHRRKRQRTFLNAFHSFTLMSEDSSEDKLVARYNSDIDDDNEDADASSSRAVAAHQGDDECGYSVTSSLEEEDDSSQAEDRLLSDKEEAERKVMLELIFGPDQDKVDVVDLKLEGLIRDSIQKASKPPSSMDDMDLDTSYQRGYDGASVSSLSGSLKRSSSLPSVLEDTMDIDTL